MYPFLENSNSRLGDLVPYLEECQSKKFLHLCYAVSPCLSGLTSVGSTLDTWNHPFAKLFRIVIMVYIQFSLSIAIQCFKLHSFQIGWCVLIYFTLHVRVSTISSIILSHFIFLMLFFKQVRNLISLGGPHAGTASVPLCGVSWSLSFCYTMYHVCSNCHFYDF